MKYKLLGKSGLRVSELLLGTMTFGKEWQWGADVEESRKIFDVYKEAGGNFLDTANIYTNGTSEKFVGEFIRNERHKWVLSTKYSLNHLDSNVNLSGNHRKNMVQSVEGSLKRLQVEYIDLLWLHIWDYTTSVEEVMRGLDDLIRTGKVFYIGISNTPAWIVSQANTLAELMGWTQFIALQIEYSLKERTPERELIPMAKAFELAVTPWSPLASGLLSGKYNIQQTVNAEKGRYQVDSDLPPMSERDLHIAKTVVRIGEEVGRSPSQVALKWILQKGYNMFPIIGARKASQIQDNLCSVNLVLSDEHMKQLDDVSRIPLDFPHDYFNSEQNFAFGGSLKTIELKKNNLA